MFCMPGRFWARERIVSQSPKTKLFTNEELGNLNSVATPFSKRRRDSLFLLGGRKVRTATSLGYGLQRVWRWFGGCRFAREHEWDQCGYSDLAKTCHFAYYRYRSALHVTWPETI
jgi:hypothetical protein